MAGPANEMPAHATGATPPAAAAREPVRVKVPPQAVEAILAAAPWFRGGDKAFLAKLAPHVEGLACPAGATLVRQGAPAEGLFLLVSGSATAELRHGEQRQVVEKLVPPASFGESAIAGAPSPFGVVADEDCRVLLIKTEIAQSLVGVPGFGEQLGRRLSVLLERVCALQPPAPEPEALLPELEAIDEVGVFDPAPLGSLVADRGQKRTPVPFVELSEFELTPSVIGMLPPKFVRQHRTLPVKLVEQQLTVAMVAPRNGSSLSELQRVLPSVELSVVAVSSEDFEKTLTRLKFDEAPRAAKGGKATPINPDSLSFESAADERDQPQVRTVGDDAIKLVNRIIVAGLEREASDVHIEPTATGVRVRYRVEGLLQDWNEQISASLAKSVVARVKVLAGLDITERRLPQDGRIGFTVGKREVDLRVSTLPANRGEKIVFRILEASGSTRSLDQIFLEPSTLSVVRRALNRPFGGIVVAGATGSGKTSTMYALLHERKANRPDTNIVTVEDPIEYRLPGVTQVQVNPVAGLQFPVVLRAMLRQDPDVIVVGETRDSETATMALEAAMTGHLLLTSLHANNAMAALQRLENLGCSRALIAQSVALVLVQRLVRRLCPACVQLDTPPKALLETLVQRRVVEAGAKIGLPRAVGCEACKQTGYSGRAVVVEALAITDDIRNAISAGKSLGDIERMALASRVLMPFHAYSAYLMGHKIVSGSEALLTVAE